ncbi:MAG: helix-turn-helix domain-containing protein [Acetobacteraceae bacterium]
MTDGDRDTKRKAVVVRPGIGVTLEEMLGPLPAQRRERVEARAAELIAEEMSIRDLRKALGKTQAAAARKLGGNVSRMEQRADVLLSTLDSCLKALGGRLRLVAEFKNRPPVTLAGFAALKGTDPDKTGRAAKSDRSHADR